MTKNQLWRVASRDGSYVGYFDTEAEAIAMTGVAASDYTVDPAVIEWPARLQSTPAVTTLRAALQMAYELLLEQCRPTLEQERQIREALADEPSDEPVGRSCGCGATGRFICRRWHEQRMRPVPRGCEVQAELEGNNHG